MHLCVYTCICCRVDGDGNLLAKKIKVIIYIYNYYVIATSHCNRSMGGIRAVRSENDGQSPGLMIGYVYVEG